MAKEINEQSDQSVDADSKGLENGRSTNADAPVVVEAIDEVMPGVNVDGIDVAGVDAEFANLDDIDLENAEAAAQANAEQSASEEEEEEEDKNEAEQFDESVTLEGDAHIAAADVDGGGAGGVSAGGESSGEPIQLAQASETSGGTSGGGGEGGVPTWAYVAGGVAAVGGIAAAAGGSSGGGGDDDGGDPGQGVNQPPEAMDDDVTTDEDTPLNGTLPEAEDPDGDDVEYALETDANNGDVTVNADGSYTYTPDADFNGSDSFEYTVSDGNGGSNTYTVDITVEPVNDAPVAMDDDVTTDEDTPLNGTLPAAEDVDGDDVDYALATNAANGDVTVNADGTYTYTPDADFNGSDSFEYSVSDGNGGSNTYTVDITVDPVNDAPVAQNDTGTATEDGAVLNGSVAGNDSDVDNDAGDLTFAAASGQAAVPGLTFNSDGSYSFNPSNAAYQDIAAGDTRDVTFDYEVADGSGGSDTATLTITVTGTNDAPIANADSDSATEDGAVINGSVTGNDNDVDNGDVLTYAAAPGQSSEPGLTFNSDGSYSFDPSNAAYQDLNDGETRDVKFNYEVTDQNGASDTATLTITVTGTNDTPVAQDDTNNATEDGAVVNGSVATNDSDPDASATLTYSANHPLPDGLSFNSDGSYSFDPSDSAYQSLAEGETQDVTLDYTVTDDNGATDTATLTITVTGRNDTPTTGSSESYETLEGETLTVPAPGLLANDSDVDNGDNIEAVLVSGPSNGSLTFNADGSFEYTPNTGFAGSSDSFQYAVRDDSGASNDTSTPVTVTIDVTQVNFEFTAGTDNFSGTAGVDEVFLGSNNNLQAGDQALGNDGDDDRVVHAIDGGATSQSFSGFEFEDISSFEVTSDGGSGPTTYDLSSSFQSSDGATLNVNNSTDDVVFNNAAAGPGDTTLLEVFDQTADDTNVTLDIRNTDVSGTDDTVDITVRDADGGDAVGTITVDAGVENIVVNSDGPLPVTIDTLDTQGGADNVTLIAQEGGLNSSLTISQALDPNVTTVDGSASTDDLSYSVVNANAATSLSGGDGNDNITGATGFANNVDSGVGDDTVTGSTNSNDNILAGDGDDVVSAGDGANTVDAGEGNDDVDLGDGNNDVTGGAGNDDITVGDGNNDITGDGGNDTIVAGNGDNDIDGGAGNDDITVGDGENTVVAGGGNDELTLGAGNNNVGMGEGEDTVNAGDTLENDDLLKGGNGDDVLNITDDNASTDLDFVQGFETINLTGGGGDGFTYNITDQTVIDPGLPDPPTPNTGPFGSDRTDSFDADDTIVTVDGSALSAGNALDFDASNLGRAIELIGGSADDELIGGEGNDTLIGNDGDDVLTGNDGDDTFRFDGVELDANDVLTGGDGNDTIELVQDTDESPDDSTDVEEDFTLDLAAGASVENVNVVDEADGGDVRLTLDGNFDQTIAGDFDLNVDATELDAGEHFTFDANGNSEDFNVASGDGDDTITAGGGDDSVTTGDGADSVVSGAGNDVISTGDGDDDVQMDGNLTGNDTLDGGAGSNTLRVEAGLTDAAFANVSNFNDLDLNTAGTTTLGSNAQNAGIDTVNLTIGADTLDAGAFTSDLTVDNSDGADDVTTGSGNDTVDAAAGNDTVSTGDGADVVNDGDDDSQITTGAGSDTVNLGDGDDDLSLGDGDDHVFVGDGDLTIDDTIAGSNGDDTVHLVNNSPVNASVDLDNVTGVENYVFTSSGNDDPLTTDADANSLSFTGGNVGALTDINIDATNLTDPDDSFEVTLESGLNDADYQFNFTGSDTADILVKENVGVNNNIDFEGRGGDDAVEIEGGDLGGSITVDGGDGNDMIRLSGDQITDDDFDNVTSFEILTANSGVGVDAVLGSAAAASGLTTVIGSDADDDVLFDAAFDNNVVVDLNAGGNDTIDAGATNAAVTFFADDDEYGAGDILTGGSSADDVLQVQTTGSTPDTADLTGVTGVETIDLLDSASAQTTIVIDTAAGEIDGGSQTVTAVGVNPLSGADNMTLQAAAATADLNVVFTHGGPVNGGNNDITTGSGNDTVDVASGDNVITTNDGADEVTAGDGSNVIDSGDGSDSVVAGDGGNTISAGDGDDEVTTGSGDDIIGAGSGADLVNSGGGDDVINAGGADGAADTIDAGDGADTITAGTGGDVIDVGDEDDAGDRVLISEAGVSGGSVDLVDGIVTIENFDPTDAGETLVFSPLLFADGTQTLNEGDPGVTQVRGDSWTGAGYPELVSISTVMGDDPSNAADVASFLSVQDLDTGDAESGMFALTDGTDTYLWHYEGDGDGSVSGSDFTLLGVLQGTTGLEGANLELNYGFTPGDDNVVVASGSTVDGLGGNDEVTIFPDDGNPTTLETSNVETVNGTSGDDTVTFVDPSGTTVDFFSNGGTDTVNLSAGMTVNLHSDVNVVVGGGNANDGFDNETVTLADGADHNVTLEADTGSDGVESVVGGDGDDGITFADNQGATVEAGGGNDTVNGANGGQDLNLTGVETLNGGDAADTITVTDGDLNEANLGMGGDTLNFQAATSTIVDGEGGNDTVNGSGNADTLNLTSVESINANGGDDIINLDAAVTASVDGGTDDDVVNGSNGNDILEVTRVESVNADDGDDEIIVADDNSLVDADLGDGDDLIVINDSHQAATIDGGVGDDKLELQTSSTGETADLTGVTGVETIDLLDIGNADTTLIVDTAAGDLDAAVSQLITTDGFDSLTGADNITLQGGDATAALEVVFNHGGDNNITTGLGADTVTTGNGDDVVNTGDGNDLVNTGSGGTTVDGGAGDDIVNGSAGFDTLNLTGVDTVNADGGDDTVTVTDSDLNVANLGGGNDSLTFQAAATATVSGDGGADDVTGSTSTDLLTLTGVDDLDARAGNDVVTADGDLTTADLGEGNDSLTYTGAANAVVDGGNGSDTVNGSSAADTFNLTDVDQMNAAGGDDTINFDAQATATVDGGAGSDTVNGTGDADDLTLSDVQVVNGDDGDDTITFAAAATATVNGGADDDLVEGSDEGDDLVFEEVEEFDGGTGDDTVTADSDLTTASLGDGADDLTYTAPVSGVDIEGGVGDDTVTFEDEAQGTVNGGDGDDLVEGSDEGDDLVFEEVEEFDGGTGDDTVTADGDLTTASLGDGADDLTYTAPVSGVDIEGGVGDDTVTFNAAAQGTVNGGADDDLVEGSDFLDNLNLELVEEFDGGDSNDNIEADGSLTTASLGGGNDELVYNASVTGVDVEGEAGDDTVTFNAAADGTVNGGADDDLVEGSDNGDDLVLEEVEEFTGGTGNDTIEADGALLDADLGEGDDTLTYTDAVTGADIFAGDGGDEVNFNLAAVASIAAGSGDDTVTGSNDADNLTLLSVETVNAGSGDDTIDAGDSGVLGVANLGEGEDVLTIGSGNIDIDGGDGEDTVNGGPDDLDVDVDLTSVEVFNGSDGVDTVEADGGLEEASLGGGNDQLTMTAAAAALVVTAGEGTDLVEFGEGGTATVIGGNGDDTVDASVGSSVALTANLDSVEKVVLSGEGDNVTFVSAAMAEVDGGGGGDSVTGSGDGDDLELTNVETVNGGMGDDTITVTDDQLVQANLGDGSDEIDFDGVDLNDIGGTTIDLGATDGAVDTVVFDNAVHDAEANNVLTIENFEAGAGGDVIDNTLNDIAFDTSYLEVNGGGFDDGGTPTGNNENLPGGSQGSVIEMLGQFDGGYLVDGATSREADGDLTDVSDGSDLEFWVAQGIGSVDAGDYTVAVYSDEGGTDNVGLYNMSVDSDTGDLAFGNFSLEQIGLLEGAAVNDLTDDNFADV